MRFTSFTATTVLLVAATFTAGAWAQAAPPTVPPADVYKVDYFSNANTAGAPDGTLRIINPGTTYTNICAYIAVFDSYEEMSECCACLVTPDGLATLSVNTDLTSNPVTGQVLQTGVIKMISAQAPGNICPLPTSSGKIPALVPSIRPWTTHIQNSNFSITETASQDSTLSNQELLNLGSQCGAIEMVGSGKGICTCGTGGGGSGGGGGGGGGGQYQ
jgi:hypothetical protein